MKKKKQRSLFRRIATALAAAVLFTLVAGSGILDSLENRVEDAFYQNTGSADGEIVIIGIDQYALETLGPLPWSRSVMANAINILNSDPDKAPAIIGVDVLYVGQSDDPDADRQLADAAAAGGNVVAAASATFGQTLVVEEDNGNLEAEDPETQALQVDDTGGFYIDDMSLLAWDRPYDALAAAADYGHINVMNDRDGILRHMLLEIDTPEGSVDSFAAVICKNYMECLNEGRAPAGDEETTFTYPETDEDGFCYLRFTASPGTYYDGVSVADLLEGTVDPDYYAGKIVLIGAYAAGLQDEYFTAADHSVKMYGVEVQANMIDAMRHGLEARTLDKRPQLVLLFFLSFFTALFFENRKMIPATTVLVLLCAGWLAACYFLATGLPSRLLQIIYIPAAVILCYLGCLAMNYIEAYREKHRIKKAFSPYVEDDVLKALMDQDDAMYQLGGVRRDIAILFVDIRGFTTMSEGLEPEVVVEVINMFLELTTRCVLNNHGTLDKFVGDCTVAFWNGPLDQSDCVYMACKAAMDMIEGAKELGKELMARFGRTVGFGVGINYGPAVVGNIGAKSRMDYTAIGDTVNTASRLESNAPAETIYISRAVADVLGDRAETTSLGTSIKLKGKADGFEILTLDQLR